MAQITRKDVENYRNGEEERNAWRIAEQRRQEEAFLQHIREEAANLGHHLKSTPKWMQAIKKLRSEVLYILATESSRGEAVAVTAVVSLSDMPWWWRRRWAHLADRCWDSKVGTSEVAKGLLEGVKATLETILPVADAYCCRRSTKSWKLIVDFWPPKD